MLHVMKILYEVEPWIAILGGIFLSFILWVCTRPPKLISARTIPPAVCVVLMILLVGGSYYAKNTYTYVPRIYLNEESLSSVRAKLEGAGFVCLDGNITADYAAQTQLNGGKDIDDNSFKVTGMDCDSDAFLERGTEINVSITWTDSFRNSSLVWQGETEFNPQEYYSGVDIDSLYGQNSDTIVVFTALAGTKSTNSGHYGSELGVHPAHKEYILAEVELVDYLNPQISWRKAAYVGDQVDFTYVPDGVYYYVVYASGYNISFASTLIKIEQQENLSGFAVGWDANLEKIGGTYSDPFYIKLEDDMGNPLRDVTVSVFVQNNRKDPFRAWSYSLVSNEDGLLTCGDDIVDFQLFEDCYIELILEMDWDKCYIVQESDPDGIAKCILPD